MGGKVSLMAGTAKVGTGISPEEPIFKLVELH